MGTSDPPSFEAFYAAHFQRLSIQLYAYTGDAALAQDFVQEAFCRAYPRWAKLCQYEDPLAWLRKVAWNLATSRFRQLRVARVHAGKQREQHVDEPSPDRVLLTTALATLPENHRRALVLRYLADLTVEDIARQEGVAEGTVKSWLHRGRLSLAARLAELKNGATR